MRIPHLSRLATPLLIALAAPLTAAQAQYWLHDDGTETNNSIFREMEEWPNPNDYRTASGAPGKGYWQQQVDYQIEAALDTVDHSITGWERISYHNNSPDRLRYLWIQLDQNVRSQEHSRSGQTQGALPDSISPQFRRFVGLDPFEGGYTLNRVQLLADGEPIETEWRVNNTLLKVLLPVPLESGGMQQLEIEWSYPIPDRARGAKEQVTDGWLYEMAQWFPRLSVYDDVNGWQTDQFMGRGEFYLNFGTYDVKVTVPWDHIVDATGELQNSEEVLTATQRQRLEQAYQSEEPVFIVRPDEVLDPATRPTNDGMLTWHFIAHDVRDFAWVSSKTYVWDAAGFRYDPSSEPIKVHSLYPRDAMPLWDKVSTRATIQTLKTYGRLAFEYPYPKAVNVHGPVFGMEYPMIAFCGARPQPDGSYSDGLERALIGVTIHEVGHNWFPMIVASDERKWTWMDEGLNTFLQYYGEIEYAQTYCGTYWTQTEDCSYPSRRGPSGNIVDYMRDTDQVPIMTHSDLIHKDFGNNGYAKPATGLVMLREHVSGEQAFDEAFGDYSKTWMFKHPQPADFFRSMEEGLGENMAWFWRGWFFTTHANDQEIVSVEAQSAEELIGSTDKGQYYYRIQVDNKGGLVMPLELEVTFEDGTTERIDLPVEVWRYNELTFKKGFFSDKVVTRVIVDPDEAYADIDRSNNVWELPADVS